MGRSMPGSPASNRSLDPYQHEPDIATPGSRTYDSYRAGGRGYGERPRDFAQSPLPVSSFAGSSRGYREQAPLHDRTNSEWSIDGTRGNALEISQGPLLDVVDRVLSPELMDRLDTSSDDEALVMSDDEMCAASLHQLL